MIHTAVCTAEDRRVANAVERARRAGLIRVFPYASAKAAPAAYVIGSSHFGVNHYRGERVDPRIFTAQVQLFILLWLLRQEGATSPLRIEGRMPGESAHVSGTVAIGADTVPLHSDEGQEFLASHSDVLHEGMRQILQGMGNGDDRGLDPMFFHISSYPCSGAERYPELNTLQFGQEELEQWARHARLSSYVDAFIAARYSARAILRTVSGVPHVLALDGSVRPAASFVAELELYVRQAQSALERYKRREDGYVEELLAAPPSQTPILWVGRMHAHRIAVQLSRSCDVRVLVPDVESKEWERMQECVAQGLTDYQFYGVDVAEKAIAALQQALAGA